MLFEKILNFWEKNEEEIEDRLQSVKGIITRK